MGSHTSRGIGHGIRLFLLGCFGIATLAAASAAVAVDTTAPGAAGPTTSTNCVSYVGDACYVNDANFVIKVTPAVDEAGGSGINAAGYQVCRSNDITGWGGCDVSLSTTSTTSFTVTGMDRPGVGKRRAYYFRSRDNAGNWGAWNSPIYIFTASGSDVTAPNAPGTTTSQCVSVVNGTCMVNPGSFTISVTAATDNAGGSGVNPSGYNFCRSNDTTGFGGCDVTLTTAGSTSFTVSGTDVPAVGQRRAYYARAKDNAGNYGAWNSPLYVQTVADTTPPSAVTNTLAKWNGANVNGVSVNVTNPTLALSWSPATDNVGVAKYQMVLQEAATGVWTYNVSTPSPATSYTLATANLQNGLQYYVWIRAIDAAGNGPNFTLVAAFTVSVNDVTPPSPVVGLSAKINGVALNNQTLSITNPSIAINWGLATDDVAVSRYQILLAAQSGAIVYNVSVNHPGTSYTLATANLVDGNNYTLQVRAIDASNNNGALTSAGTFLIRFDTTAPSAVGNFSGKLNTRDIAGQKIPWSNPSIDLSWSAATDAGGIKRYSVTLERTDVAGIVSSVMIANNVLTYTFPSSGLVVGGSYRYAIKAQDKSDNWGPVSNTGSFTILPALSSSVQPMSELMINVLPVVEDSARTTGCGPWTLCAVMTALVGQQDPADFTERFFRLHDVKQVVNGQDVPAVSHVTQRLLDPSVWPRVNGKLDLTRPSLRLLAIVNRADLVRPGDAGEARLVFGFQSTDFNGFTHKFTMNFEYKMSTSLLSRAQWWAEWHRLDSFDPASEDYRSQLQFLTDKFARTPVGGQISLGQLRTNDGLASDQFFWEFREFMQTGGGADIVETTLKQVPQSSIPENTIGEWINAHEAEILTETHVVSAPLTLAATDAFTGVSTPSNVRNRTAGMLFSKNTCAGCHIDNSSSPQGSLFFQIGPRDAGKTAKLSDFFFNVTLCGDDDTDDGHCAISYVQNELGRRQGVFQQDLGGMGFGQSKSGGANSEVSMHEPTDEEVVTLDSMSRVD